MSETSEPFSIVAGETGWAWCVDASGELRQLAVGPTAATAVIEAPRSLYPRAIPAFGTEPHARTALRVTHHDGTRSTRLSVVDVARSERPHGELLRISQRDRDLGLSVDLLTETWVDHDVVAQWVEVTNTEPGPVTVWECASSAPLLAGPAPTWTHLGGGWAAEWTPTHERLRDGSKLVESTGGVRPHLQVMPALLASASGDWSETGGTVLAGQLAWTGNTSFEAEVRRGEQLRLLCGASFRAAELVLSPGERVRMPEVVWAWSSTGLGPLSRRLHRWVRAERVRDGDRDRVIVANNWEATFFDFDERRLEDLVDDAAELGAELFLLDDGWFGRSHPRDDDTQGLGDWVVDERKLPGGLEPVISAALGHGLRFGLWVEPEMVNPGSTLFAVHPDWVLGDPARPEPNLERHQLALDLLRPEVRDFVVDTVCGLLDTHPDVSYVKWDANRALVETGSPTLDPGRQGRVFFDLVGATWEVMARIAERHPEVEMMLCASGGGRVDLGALRYFHEVWTSDNTDALERVRMQSAASWFLPAEVVAAHVTRWGGHPLTFAAAVAMSARFGWDLDTAGLTAAERGVLGQAAAVYKRIRPIVQHGDLHRLESPFGAARAALAHVGVGDHVGSVVVFGFQLTDDPAGEPLALAGLAGHIAGAAEVQVRTTVLGEDPRLGQVTARSLWDEGLEWPLRDAATAVIWELQPAG